MNHPYSDWTSAEKAVVFVEGEYLAYLDEWGVKRRMPKEGSLYFDVVTNPLDLDDLNERFRDYPWPDPANPSRLRNCDRRPDRLISCTFRTR